MAKAGKSNSSKKGKPSYFMSIMGVTIVLFIWGLLGLLAIYANTYRKQVSENIKVNVYFDNTASQVNIDSTINYVKVQPYTKEVVFTSKEQAKESMIGSKDESIDFDLIDSINPLPNSISFTIKDEFVKPEKLKEIKSTLLENTAIINDVTYSDDVVKKINAPLQKIKYGLLAFALILSILVFLLIDNTIKLAMYSNRFLIKTMQMVGATRNFIALPMDKRAVINGFLSSAIAIAILYVLAVLMRSNLPDVIPHLDQKSFMWLCISLILAGVLITLISTHRSVIKYLKMKLDDLY
jgi:cell division transport system permease protein